MMTPNTGIGARNPAGTPRSMTWWVRSYQWLASREMLACAAIFLLTLGLRAALLPWLPVPEPAIHDEFSYLLASDTYTHGRLTNPPHPFWQHFETFHELMQPTYASKYQPLQGLVLAFGQKLFGEPWIGVYFSTGFMCAAICWMLQGWIAPEWALFGALLCTLRVGLLSYWMNSYFGGSVAAIGGALALGALARVLWRRQFVHSITWALGLSILVLSRPFDAAVMGCATAAMLAWFLLKSHAALRAVCARVAFPALLVFATCAAGVAYNDYRVTGHALTLPYQLNEQQYAVMSAFALIPRSPEPYYRHPVLRNYWVIWQEGLRKRDREHPLLMRLITLFVLSNFFFPLRLLLIPVLFWPYDLTSAQERATAFLLLVFVVMMAVLVAPLPHYAAAFTGVFYLRALQGIKRLWSWRPGGKPVGLALGKLAVALLLCVAVFGSMYTGKDAFGLLRGRDVTTEGFAADGSQFKPARRSIVEFLNRQPGRQLVMVRYPADYIPLVDWVYNRADIDGSPIVWAREMGEEQDRPFLNYFHDRRVWLLEPDRSSQLSPYPVKEGLRP